MKKILMSIISLAFMALSTSAMAATTAPAPLAVSATGVISCTSTSADIVFGTYDATVDKTASGSAGATCNAGAVALTISIDTGANYDTVGATRRLINGSNYLNYEIYQTSAQTTIFGDGTHGSTVSMNSGSTAPHAASHTALGVLLAGQSLVAGAYSDTVNVTVTY